MMCACRNCWVVALAGGLLVSALAGVANAEQAKIPIRIAAAQDARSDASPESATSDPKMTLRGGGACDTPALCDGDANGDGLVDPLDSGAILARFGLDPCAEGTCQYDVNCDGVIDPLDSGYVLARFGVCNPVPDCSTPGCTPANDNCADAIEVFEGDTPFSNVGATRDGPDDCPDADTGEFNTGQSDIWYAYTATQDGFVLISLCNDTDYDSSMSIYSGTDCPVGASLLCSDDDCGLVGGPSELTADLNMGDVVTIRVGGWNNGDFPESEQGTGTLTIKTSGGPCCVGHTIPGCDEIGVGDPAEVEACVCDLDSFCCDVIWDDACASFVELFGCGSCLPANCGAGNGDCCLEAGNGSPGCDDEECCDSVCDFDSFCCDTDWDSTCAGLAGNCVVCGGDGCLPPDCEACCFVDGTCQDLVPGTCVGDGGGNQGEGTTCAGGGCEGSSCPDDAVGDCCDLAGNGTPGCDDPECCALVCDIDPFCCDNAWDDICAGEAEELCELCAP
ncbi:MAG: hypothetical protein IID37_14880 [Planctomycetes bacterium]|nr:hypothetical protein [Planctomycetota bacterium]